MSVSLSNAIAMMLETGAATLEELLDARLVLEAPLAGLAAYNADDQAKARLRAAVEAEAAADQDDPESLGIADAEIHRTVAAASGNRMLQALVGWVFEVLQPQLMAKVHGTVVHSAVVDQHRALLRAVERGDAARAERAMKDHLLYLRDVLRMVDGEGARHEHRPAAAVPRLPRHPDPRAEAAAGPGAAHALRADRPRVRARARRPGRPRPDPAVRAASPWASGSCCTAASWTATAGRSRTRSSSCGRPTPPGATGTWSTATRRRWTPTSPVPAAP